MSEKRLSPGALLRKESKRQARALMDEQGNRTSLVLMVCIWVATAGAIFLFCGALPYAADESVFTDQPSALAMALVLAAYALMALLALVVLLPMGVSIVHAACRISDGEARVGVDAAFEAFGSFGRYVRFLSIGAYALLLPCLALLCLLISFLCGSVAYSLVLEWSASSVWSWVAAFVAAVPAALVAPILLLAGKGTFVTVGLVLRGMTFRAARRLGRKEIRRARFSTLFYRLSFVGWLALAVITVGATAVLDTIPYVLLCEQTLCKSLILQEKINKEINK